MQSRQGGNVYDALMRVSGRLYLFHAAPITADALPSIRGPCARPRRSDRGSVSLPNPPGLSAPARYCHQKPK